MDRYVRLAAGSVAFLSAAIVYGLSADLGGFLLAADLIMAGASVSGAR